MRDYGWSDEVAVAEKPLTQTELAVKEKQAADREAARLAKRVEIRERIKTSEQAESDAVELASLRDQTAAEVGSLKSRLGSLESQLIGEDGDNEILDEQANIAQQIVRKQAQQNALHRRYLATCAMIDATAPSELLTTGRSELKAVAAVRRRVADLLERGLSGLREDRDRYSPEEFALHETAYLSELSLARARATEAVQSVRDE